MLTQRNRRDGGRQIYTKTTQREKRTRQHPTRSDDAGGGAGPPTIGGSARGVRDTVRGGRRYGIVSHLEILILDK